MTIDSVSYETSPETFPTLIGNRARDRLPQPEG